MAKIFSAQLTIESMKDSGYKDAAHAIAELIDNSIQAGDGLNETTNVEILCVEKEEFINERSSSKIEEIAVYDDACGMLEDVLSIALAFGQGTRKGAKKGIGKFGMGLPNASISQADRVDVWSWVDGQIFHTYLDVDEVIKNNSDELPCSEKVEKLPDSWIKRIKSPILSHGSLIVWSKLSRLKWKRHKAFFSNTEFIVGRIYRYFISNEKTKIRMAAFVQDRLVYDEEVKPNDPLYLMTNTSAPEPHNTDPVFELFGEYPVSINYHNGTHIVKIKVSIVKDKLRRSLAEQGKNLGNEPIGKHCSKNQGVSVVRAGRELELNGSFEIPYDPTERWWGVEVAFEPELDEVFGVTNNKQAATAFRKLTLDEVANSEDISRSRIEDFLRQENDIRLPVILVSNEISSKLGAIRTQLEKQTKGVKVKKDSQNGATPAQFFATKISNSDGEEGISDKRAKELDYAEKEKEIEKALEEDGVDIPPEDRASVVKSWLDDSKFIFSSAKMSGSRYIFDISQPAGKIKVTFNEAHPAYETFLKKIQTDDSHAFEALKLLFAAWARMEDIYMASNKEVAERLEEIRFEWGDKAKRMLDEYNG